MHSIILIVLCCLGRMALHAKISCDIVVLIGQKKVLLVTASFDTFTASSTSEIQAGWCRLLATIFSFEWRDLPPRDSVSSEI